MSKRRLAAGSLVPGIRTAGPGPDDLRMGDGRTFAQAVRALDKFIAEQSRRQTQVPDPDSPVRRAYERIVAGGATARCVTSA